MKQKISTPRSVVYVRPGVLGLFGYENRRKKRGLAKAAISV